MRQMLRALTGALVLATGGCPRSAERPVENTPMVSTVRDAAAPGDGGDMLSAMFTLGAAAVQLTRDVLNPYARRENSGDPWTHHAIPYRDRPGTNFTHTCPPNGTLSASVWGSTIYTDDSSICSAAVHAGVITREQGGAVRVYLHGPRNGFVGSGDRGLLTRSYRWFPGSFAFTETVPEDVFPPPEDAAATDGAVDASVEPTRRAR